MYTVDEKDKVIRLEDIPQSSVGAPCPAVFGDEQIVIANFITQEAVSRHADDNAFVKFYPCYAYMFGPPNDEAFSGHPLAGRGLEPYGAFKIENSSWIRQLERMNSVHPYHKPEHFDIWTHYILLF